MKEEAVVSPKARLSERDATALADFIQRVRAALGDQVFELRLFGSKARGDAGPDADLDVLVVVGPPATRWPCAKTVSNIAFDVNLDHEVFISPIVLTTAMVADPGWAHSPFARAIHKDGVPL